MPNGFTPQQVRAAQALASGLSQGKAAKEANVTRITVIRWLKKPEFCRKVEELRGKAEKASDSSFVQITKEVVKENVRRGAMTEQEMILLVSSIARDNECRVSDRLKAVEVLSRLLSIGDSKKRYHAPPSLPTKPFGNTEMSHRLDLLRSKAITVCEFLVDRAAESGAHGDLQEATAVLSKSLDVAGECTPDVPYAANTLMKENFVVLHLNEYYDLLPDGQKSSSKLLQPLNFDRAFSWRWLKRQKSS